MAKMMFGSNQSQPINIKTPQEIQTEEVSFDEYTENFITDKGNLESIIESSESFAK